MGIEQLFETVSCQLTDPHEFLSRPAWYGLGELDIGRLAEQPSMELLRKVPWVRDDSELCEVGILRRKGIWFIFKTGEFYNKREFAPVDAQVWIHSHPVWEGHPPDAISFFLPSINDFDYCLGNARNFVISQDGLTEYWPILINGERIRRSRINEVIREMEIGDTNDEYMRFLNSVKAKFQLYTWEELTSERLAELLS